jgi:hypothetical protein
MELRQRWELVMKDSNWDLDLRDGEAGESKLADLLRIDTIEVKTDRRWKDTGNLFIEESCFYQGSGQWEPSGLSVSKATHWAFIIEGNVIIVTREHLMNVVMDYGRPIENKQPPNQSKGHLITPEQLINYTRMRNDKFDKAGEAYKNREEQEYPV